MSQANPQDLETLVAARRGDEAAAREIVARHGPSMIRTARRVLGRYGGTEADDVVQEALIAALVTPSLPREDVGAWLRAIAARKALDWLRRPSARRETPLDPDDAEGNPPPAATGSGSVADVLAVRQALSRLSAKDRAVLVLADLEGRSMREVATALGTTVVATKLRASRARRKLAAILDGGEGGRR